MNRTVPCTSSVRCASRRAAPTSIATCASCPQACIDPSTSLANGRPVSSGMGSASISAPGRDNAAVAVVLSVEVGDDGRHVLADAHVEIQIAQRLDYGSLGAGQDETELWV